MFINLRLNTLLKRLKQQEVNVDVVKRAAEATSKVGLKKKLKQWGMRSRRRMMMMAPEKEEETIRQTVEEAET